VVLVVGGGGSGGGGRPSDNDVAKAMQAAGCTFASKPVLPPVNNLASGFHLNAAGQPYTPTSKIIWNTFPPDGGSHYQVPASWGFYTESVPPNLAVHNEEHGGVILWWGPSVSQATVNQLYQFYKESPAAILGTPIDGLGKKIAITAWTGDPSRYYQNGYYGIGHLATCTKFDEKAFKTFRDAFRAQGPERFPLSELQPGQ
jgi:hypothetical protein